MSAPESTAQAAPLLDGVEITLQGRTFIVPPLSLAAIKRAIALLPVLEAGGMASLDAAHEIVHRAFARNYPELTLDELGDLLDTANLVPTMSAILARSGLVLPAPAAPLEVPAAPAA